MLTAFFSTGRRGLAALAVAALGLAAGGIAYASLPDSNGIIHGCYNPSGAKSSGGTSLNIIDSPYACPKGQQAITWNQQGPKGATGARGPTGANGTNGTNGSRGPTGPKGPTGASGASNSYAAFNSHVVDIDGRDGKQQIVGVSELPAGDYLVWATITNGGVDVNSDDMVCNLTGPNGDIEPKPYYNADFPLIEYGHTVTFTGFVKDAPANTLLSVNCGKISGEITDTPPIALANIEALPVGNLG